MTLVWSRTGPGGPRWCPARGWWAETPASWWAGQRTGRGREARQPPANPSYPLSCLPPFSPLFANDSFPFLLSHFRSVDHFRSGSQGVKHSVALVTSNLLCLSFNLSFKGSRQAYWYQQASYRMPESIICNNLRVLRLSFTVINWNILF